MITKIKIKNSSGILDEVTLDLNKGKYDYRNHFVYNDAIVNPAVLYGRNGSGKTSVLKSINNIIQIFSGDLQSGAFYAMPHEFTDNLITEITLEFILDNKAYTYEVHIEDKNNIAFERLKANTETIVYRNYDKVELCVNNLHVNEELLSNIYSNLSIVRYLGMNAIDKEFASIYEYFKSFRFVGTNKAISSIGETESIGTRLVKYNDKYPDFLQDYKHIMKLKFKLDKQVNGERIVAVYQKDNKEYDLDFETQISSGTKDLYMMLSTLFSLKPGSLIVIDELEKTFHPELLDKLVRDVVTKCEVQIICSTHNTHLLQSLRPDQVYFTKRNNEMTTISRLSTDSPGIREIHNIEKLYLGGRIG